MLQVPGDKEFDAEAAVDNYVTKPVENLRAPGSMRESMAEAVRTNPDEHAEARKIADRTGVPITSVFENRDEIVRQYNFDNFDFDTYESMFPASASLLSDTEFARLAHDDAQNMGLIETSVVKLNNVGRAITGAPFALGSGVLGVAQTGAALTEKFYDDIGDPLGRGAPYGVAADLFGYGRRSGQQINADILAPALSNSGPLESAVYSGVQSFATQLPGMVASVITKNPAFALTSAGVVSGGTAAGKALDQELDPLVALGYGLSDATVEVGTELIPVTKFLGDLKAGSGFFKTLGHQVAAEVPGELLATTLQNFNEWAFLNQDQSFQTYLEQLPPDLAQTFVATLVAVGANTGTITLGNAAVSRMADREKKATAGEAAAQTVEELTEVAKASKLLQRDPDSFERFIEAANEQGDVQDIYFDPKDLAQSGVDLDALAEISPSVRKQVQLATETGGLLKIPLSEYATTVAPSDLGKSLLDHAKTDPLGMSRKEAKEFMQSAKEEFEAEVTKTLEEGKQTREFLRSREVVYQNIFDQLDTANRFTEDVNTQYATLLANFYAVQAQRFGTTPEQMFAQYPVGVQAQSVVEGPVLEQKLGGVEGPFRDVTGKPFNSDPMAIRSLNRMMDNQDYLEVELPVSKLNATQDQVNDDFREAGKDIKNDGYDLPAVVKYEGQYYVTDGHHRIMASSSEGNSVVKVRLFDIDGDTETDFPLIDQLEQEQRGSFNPETSMITLLKAADLSTFLHEAGHFFLETLNKMALDPNAPQEIKDDMKTFLKWSGAGTVEQWNAMPLDQQRPFHEKFARGFEAYLFEGKSPNAEMQGLFARFRDWLLMVYKNVKNLNVDLSDDIRGVFDRLLATSETIAEAESLTGFKPAFASAEDAGMSAEEWVAYQKLGLEATEQARAALGSRTVRDIKWLSNARSKKLRELQKDAEGKRRAVRREVTEEVMNEPVNQARSFIRTGHTVDGVKTEGIHRIDIAALKEMYGDAPDALWRALESKYGKYGMVGNEGLHPDAIADQFGFTSGDELVKALITAENPRDKIQGLTDQRMLERYGDLTDPKTLERAADAAIHNDARAKFVATEVNALNRVTGKRKILNEAAKDYARRMVARLRVRDVKPSRYTAAEAKAARAAEKAMRAGDLELAGIEKRSQLIQLHAAKEAHETLDFIDKAVRYFNKFNKDNVRQKLSNDYLDQIDALLERFDLRKAITLKQIDRRKSLVEWIEAQREIGAEPDIPVEMLDGANRKHYKEMTVEELRGLFDTVKQIEHLGRLKEKLLTAQDERNFKKTVEDLADSIYANSKGRVADNTTRATTGDRLVRLFKGYLAQHRKVSSLARQMDGVKDGGPMWETFIRSMNIAGDTEASMRAEATKKLAVLVAPIMKQGKMNGKGVYFPTINRSLNREERIALALNTGNSGNLQRLLDGEGWTLDQIQPVLDTITAEEAKFVQDVWDLFESYRPQIGAKEKRVYGKEPEWIEPTSITLGGVELKGGYFPIKYDHRRSIAAEQHNEAEVAKQQLRGAYTSATTRRSFVKSRAEEVRGRPLMLTMDGLYAGLNEVIHDLSWHEWLIDANRLMRSRKLDAAIRETYGAETVQQFKSAIKDIAIGEMPTGGNFEKVIGNLRNGASVAGLGLNLLTAAINVSGISQSFVRVGPKWILQGIGQWTTNPVETITLVYEKSDFMRLRGQTMNREINEIQNLLRDKNKIRAAIDRYSYLPLTMTQVAIDIPTWYGAYQKALAEGNNETRAVQLADQAVLDSQGGGQVKDLAAIQRGGPLQKLFTTFYSYFSTTLQLTAEQTSKTNFRDPKDIVRLGGDYLMLYTVPALMTTIIRGLFSGGWDEPEELAAQFINEEIGYVFGTVVGLRELSGAVQKAAGVDPYNTAYGGPAGLRFMQEFDKLGTQIGQGDLDRALLRSLVNVGGVTLRLPSSQINRTIDGAAAIMEGNTANPLALVTGAPR
ncbi:MAG: ParB N-terminal domain-containing protein [Alphaproteobacteria bacterium]|nr:ParB N-terminal domain-containing protein [Alphaproteobacteria bacterium]